MADDPHNTSDVSDPVDSTSAKEDAETTAARRELKQTSISEKAGHDAQQQASQEDRSGSDNDDSTSRDKAAADREATPDTDAGDVAVPAAADLRERVSSPKKKRAHAELADSFSAAGEGSSKPASTTVAQSRTEESEPEKKRPRDHESERRRSQDGEESDASSSKSRPDKTSDKTSVAKSAATDMKGTNGDKLKPASASAFASSGFAKLAASSTSPFGALGGAGKPSLFGSSGSSGSFSVLGGPKPPTATSTAPKLSFGGSATAASPFALNGKPTSSVFGGGSFGGSFGGTFGGSSLSGGSRLSTFGKPGEALKSAKPARPFGAPDSDADEEVDEEDDDAKDDESGSDKEEGSGADKEKDDSKAPLDDKKKPRLHKIVVDDGESSEVTLLAVRAKMYVMEKGVGWKERGAGMLKVNVPKVSVDLDGHGNPDPTSFDASVLDDEDEDNARHNVRLILRQDHTLRVILNTAIVPAMTFTLNPKLKAAYVLFTAFEDGQPKQVQMKLSEANATLFTQLMDMIKRQLSDI